MARGIRRLARRTVSLTDLLEQLPDDLRSRTFTHSSWTERRADSYGRLAFLGDSVLGIAIAEHLYRTNPKADIGRLTKVHGQAVSGRACAAVAHELGLDERLREAGAAAPETGIALEALLESERALASVCEAVIGACYLHHGFVLTQEATVAAFAGQIEMATETLLDYKSALQERLARDGAHVIYAVTAEVGPPHDRRFDVDATVAGKVIGSGSGRSKKAAEQEAAAQALAALDG